jgi:hypothetical protein
MYTLKIFKLIKNAVRLILDNFRIVGLLFFGRIQMVRLTFLFILILFLAEKFCFEVIILAYGTDYGPTAGRQEECSLRIRDLTRF